MRIFRAIIFSIGVFISTYASSQIDSAAIDDIRKFQRELNNEYLNPKESPLDSADRLIFPGHDFYPIDLKYRITANFKRTPDEETFKMKTTGTRTPEYVKYGEITFTIDNKLYKLNIYQNIALTQNEEYKDYLFLPFTDKTNGNETYGGGRYIDLRKPDGNDSSTSSVQGLVVDFNKAYNPYCAYSHKYSCPIPPPENNLDTEIKAGIKMNKQHD